MLINKLIFHLDMDAFFASIEQREHPEFKGLPVVVGAKPGGRLGGECGEKYTTSNSHFLNHQKKS